MKLVQILYSGLGGHGSVAFSLSAAARAHHAWSDHYLFFGIEPLLEEYRQLCLRNGVDHAYLPVRQGWAWLSWMPLYRALSAMRPDAIVLHSVKAILPCWMYARAHGLPLVAVEHQPNHLKSRSEWVVSRLLMKLADAVVVLTPEYASVLRGRLAGAWRDEKVHLIPNGIDTEAFRPVQRVRPTDSPARLVGMAARFSSTKRPDLVVGALKLLLDRSPGVGWRISLAGEGEGRRRINEAVLRAKLEMYVELPGYLGGAALLDWFTRLDYYVHASEGETLSTSLLQAMAMGLPIVGSNVSGITNLLAEGGGCGLVADDQSPEAFARALQHFADSPGLAGALGIRARKLVVEKYSQDAMFTRYHELLTRVCTKSSN